MQALPRPAPALVPALHAAGLSLRRGVLLALAAQRPSRLGVFVDRSFGAMRRIGRAIAAFVATAALRTFALRMPSPGRWGGGIVRGAVPAAPLGF